MPELPQQDAAQAAAETKAVKRTINRRTRSTVLITLAAVLAAVLLQFLADHPKLARPVGTTDRYPQMLESVRQNGLQFTGVWVQGAPSDLLVLAEDDCVWSIYNYHAQVRLSTDD